MPEGIVGAEGVADNPPGDHVSNESLEAEFDRLSEEVSGIVPGMSCGRSAVGQVVVLTTAEGINPSQSTVFGSSGEVVARHRNHFTIDSVLLPEKFPNNCPFSPEDLTKPTPVNTHHKYPNLTSLQAGRAVGHPDVARTGSDAIDYLSAHQDAEVNFRDRRPENSEEMSSLGCPADCPNIAKGPELLEKEQRLNEVSVALRLRAEAAELLEQSDALASGQVVDGPSND